VNDPSKEAAQFEMQDGERSRVSGALDFATVGALLPLGADAIATGRAVVINLAGVTASDSAGLALLIEWLSIAHTQQRVLRYENLPSQLNQLAELSEVEELLVPPKSTDGREPRLP
jgi:phospholipid transport system transporter-binding protein